MRKTKSLKVETTLVIPDAHDCPEAKDKSRFDALGNFICDQRPDNIVQIGDFLSMDSITQHLRGKLLLSEGKRLKDDLDSGREAYNRMMAPLNLLNSARSKWKKKHYSPKKYWLEANHEYRCLRYILDKPELEGFVPTEDLLGVAKDGWNIINYGDHQYIRGTAFTHIPHYFSKEPIRGKYPVRRALELYGNSVVFGHTHRLSLDELPRETSTGDGKITALSVGWYGDYLPQYALGGVSVTGWWSGLVMLDHFDHGKFGIRTYPIELVKKQWL